MARAAALALAGLVCLGDARAQERRTQELPAQALPAQELIVNRDLLWPMASPDEAGFVDRVIREACLRAGVAVRFQVVPSERSLRNVDAGIDDADAARIAGVDAHYPHLVPVPEPLLDAQFVAFAVDPGVRLTFADGGNAWAALNPYHVAVVRGWKDTARLLTGARSVTHARTPTQLFELLARGRVDVVVFERLMGLALARDLGVEGLRALSPPLATLPTFMYVHERHAALAPRIADGLRAMKADGSYARLVAELLAPVAEAP